MAEKTVEKTDHVYVLHQCDFRVIPGSPWVYSIEKCILQLFRTFQPLEGTADIVLGMKTSDNFRFVRYWWEINRNNTNWMSYEKHVTGFPYYYPTHALVLWNEDSIAYFHDYYSAQLPNKKYWMRPGINFSSISSTRFTTKLLVEGRMCDMAANTIFPFESQPDQILGMLGILNSNLCQYLIRLLNPTINIQVIDVKRIPFPKSIDQELVDLVTQIIRLKIWEASFIEQTYDFKISKSFSDSNHKISSVDRKINHIQSQIENNVYELYDIGIDDRKQIEFHVNVSFIDNQDEITNDNKFEKGETEDFISLFEVSPHWLSYAVGIVLGRFQPGVPDALGSAIYQKSDFAIGSLPET
jgi:hypothetical protein